MNKFTLKFKDNKTESTYQQIRNLSTRVPMYTSITIAVFIVFLIKLIMLLSTQKQYTDIILVLLIEVYLIISILFVKFKPQYVQYGLILLNYIILFYQYIIETTLDNGESKGVFTANVIVCNVVIMLHVDFITSSILAISTFVFRLVRTIMNDQDPQYNIYVATIFILFFLIYCFWNFNNDIRTHFVLSEKDNLWETIFPLVVNKPFILFQFIEEELKYEFLKSENFTLNVTNSQELKEFLSQWKYRSKTLNDFFFNYFKQKQIEKGEFITRKIHIYKEKKQSIQINYTIIMNSHITILIRVQNNKEIQEFIKQYIAEAIQKQWLIQYKMLKCVTANIKLLTFQSEQINHFQICCYKQLLNYLILNQKISKTKQFNIENIIQELQRLFSYKKFIYKIQIEEQNMLIIGFRPFYIRILLEIFGNAQKNTLIQFNFDNEDGPLIQYKGDPIIRNKDKAIHDVFNSLVKKQQVLKENQRTYITLLLWDQPIYPFTNTLAQF